MARGTTLATIVQMVKAELMVDTDAEVSPGGDSLVKQQAATQQKWLALRHTWPFLRIEKTVDMVAGTRYYALPNNGGTPYFELGKPLEVDCYFGTLWNPVEVGIDPRLYNSLNPALGQKCDPVARWQLIEDSGTLKFEVWPLPSTATQIRFAGSRVLNAFTSDAHTADLDDLLIAQFTAAKLATRMKGMDAAALLAQANETLRQLRAGYPSEPTIISFTGPTRPRVRDWSDRPTVAAMITPP